MVLRVFLLFLRDFLNIDVIFNDSLGFVSDSGGKYQDSLGFFILTIIEILLPTQLSKTYIGNIGGPCADALHPGRGFRRFRTSVLSNPERLWRTDCV